MADILPIAATAKFADLGIFPYSGPLPAGLTDAGLPSLSAVLQTQNVAPTRFSHPDNVAEVSSNARSTRLHLF